MKILIRKIHRWLGLLMALQIIAWMLSGFYFSLFPIQQIRGEHLTRPVAGLDATMLQQARFDASVSSELAEHLDGDYSMESLRLVSIHDRVAWRVSGDLDNRPFARLLDSASGAVLPMLSAEEAVRTGRWWLHEAAGDVSVEWVEEAPANRDIRAGMLPAWKISVTEPEDLNLYLHPWTGEILARRTARWRLFDFLWMLHIMDYDEREDFSHPLLQVAAFLGLVVALSGLVFWLLTTRLFRRRNPA